MGLFDKVKDFFTEPVEDGEEEIKVEQIKKEVTRVTPTPVIEKKRERVVEEEPTEEEVLKEAVEEEQPIRRERVKTPVFFTADDFADLEPEKPKKIEKKREEEVRPITKKVEEKKPYSGNYGGYTSTSILTKEKPTFKPTPIISPIYGILDKNYSKEDIVEKKDNNREEKNVDVIAHDRFDEIRNKAYGTLENELEETIYDEARTSRVNRKQHVEEEIDLFDELEQEEKPKKKRSKEINLEDTAELAKTVTEQEKNIRELEEITMDLTKELDNLLLKKETFNSKKAALVQEQPDEDIEEPLTENELFNLIDSMYEEGKE